MENWEEKEEMNEEEEFFLNHTDKLVGVFTEPTNTFEKIAKYPVKTVDWLLPLVLMIIVSVVANFVIMSNPTVKYKFVEETMKITAEKYDEMVQAGKLTREQADKALEAQRQMFEKGSQWLIISSVSQFIGEFIKFFVVVLVFYLLAKLLLNGEGTYSGTMVAYGLPLYILVIQIILMVLATMLTDRLFSDLSVASFLGMDKTEFWGYLLSKADIFLIWFYGIVGVGLAKMHKSENVGKYLVLVYSTWIGFSLLAFYLGQNVALLAGLAR